MQRYTDQVLSAATGLPVLNATIAVFLTGTTMPAPLFSDAGVTPISNPFTITGGGFTFYAADGTYDLAVTTGGNTRLLSGVQLVDLVDLERRLGNVEDGTPGAAGSLRADLMASTGASHVSFMRTTAPHTVSARLAEVISAGDWNLVGDGFAYTLTQFAGLSGIDTLAKAKAAYGPHVDSMNRSVNWCALQGAINFAAAQPYAKTVEVPAGRYMMLPTDTLVIPNSVTLIGRGTVTIGILNWVAGDGSSVISMAPGSTVEVTLRSLNIVGGDRAIYLNGTDVTRFYADDVNVRQANYAIYCVQALQVSRIRGIIEDCNWGLYCPGTFTNGNQFTIDFNRIANSQVYFRGSEVNLFLGGRMEGGGVNGRIAIDITNSRDLQFRGTYFENVHSTLVSDVQSSSGVSFDGCHFSGGPGLVAGFTFTSDGVIKFGSNSAYMPYAAPARALLTGLNPGMDVSASVIYRSLEPNRTEGTINKALNAGVTTFNIANLTRLADDGALSNGQVFYGEVEVALEHFNSGGFHRYLVQTIDFAGIVEGAANAFTVSATNRAATLSGGDGGAPTVALSIAPGATAAAASLQLAFANVSAAAPFSSALAVRVLFKQRSTELKDTIGVTLLN